MKKISFIFILFLLISEYALANEYSVRVRRIDQNLYEDTRQNIVIKTRRCFELGFAENAILNIDRNNRGELLFLNLSGNVKATCPVDDVYEKTRF